MPGRHHDCADDEVRVDEDSSAPFCGAARSVVRGMARQTYRCMTGNFGKR